MTHNDSQRLMIHRLTAGRYKRIIQRLHNAFDLSGRVQTILRKNKSRMAFQGSSGTIFPRRGFDAAVGASMLEKAMKGSGCDQKEIRRVVTGMNNAQRQAVREQYQTTYGKDLIQELKKELSGDFEQVIVALMEPPAAFDASHLRYSMKGLGTTESILIDILCTRTTNQIRAIKSTYIMEFGRSLDTDIMSDTSGDFEEILVALVQCTRDEGDDVDVNLARNEAKRMLGNKDLKLKPDKETFKMAFANENYRQLETLFDEYQLLSGQTIQKGIEKTFSGDAKAAYLAIVDSIQDAPKYFARRLYESMKGLGTDDMDLIGIVVSRSEIDLAEVSKKFEKTYKRSLVDFIKSECSGEYCETLVKLVNGN